MFMVNLKDNGLVDPMNRSEWGQKYAKHWLESKIQIIYIENISSKYLIMAQYCKSTVQSRSTYDIDISNTYSQYSMIVCDCICFYLIWDHNKQLPLK